ncbi:MAG: hypothetical protein ACRDDZ_01285 [Marinifilaceae bacterium]
MVRYPHIAKLISSQGSVVKGEFVEANPSVKEIRGRLELLDKKIVRDANGNETQVNAQFFCKEREKWDMLELDGVQYKVVYIDRLQTHSVIYLK